MADKTLRLFILGDSASAEAALARTAAASDATEDAISDAGTRAGTKFGDAIDAGTSRAGNSLKSLSSSLSSWGFPTGGLDKLGSQLDSTATKGKKFGAVMSEVGKLALVGGAVAFAGVAVEAVHMADAFDTAQASLETAVTNSGGVWDQYKGQVADAARTTSALVTGNSTDIDQALATLTTATGSTSKALKDLTLTENIAAFKHISLGEAAAGLAKVYGGNIRILAQWGINLDIASGKLHSIQAAEEAVQKDTLAYNAAVAEKADGETKGVKATTAVVQAALTLRNASLNLKQSQTEVTTVMAALDAKTKGAADTLGKTLPGELAIARNTVHNLGTEFGEWLLPYINEAGRDLAGFINWLDRNKVAGEALAVVIGGALATAVSVFAFNKISAMVSGLGKMASAAGTAAQKMLAMVAPTTQAGNATATADSRIVTSNEATQLSFEGMGTAAETSSATAGTAVTGLAADVTAADSTIEADNAAAAASFTAMGPAILGVTALVGGLVAEYEILNSVASAAQGPYPPGSAKQLAWQASQANKPGAGGFATNVYAAAAENNMNYGIVPATAGLRYDPTNIKDLPPAEKAKVVALAKTIATPGSKIPDLGSIPSVGGGSGAGNSSGSKSLTTPADSLKNSVLTFLQTIEAATESGTVVSLRKLMTQAMTEKLALMVTELKATHQAALEALIPQLLGAYRNAQQELNEALEAKYDVALADQTAIISTEMTDLTTQLTNMATSRAQVMTDTAQITVDKLGERGLYGLALVAQEMKVGLDKVTVGFDKQIGADQQRLDAVTKIQDAAVQAAQKRVDEAATGSAVQQELAAAALKRAESNAALIEAQASRTLADAQNAAKLAETKAQALIAIEEARAQTQYAGSGLVVNQYGLDMNNAQANAAEIAWLSKTKVLTAS